MEVMSAATSSGAATTLGSVRPAMLRMVVKDVALREGIENPNALAEATGLPYETCRRLWNKTPAMIGISTIERLCDVLKVRPGQLFDYEHEPDKAERKVKKSKR